MKRTNTLTDNRNEIVLGVYQELVNTMDIQGNIQAVQSKQ